MNFLEWSTKAGEVWCDIRESAVSSWAFKLFYFFQNSSSWWPEWSRLSAWSSRSGKYNELE